MASRSSLPIVFAMVSATCLFAPIARSAPPSDPALIPAEESRMSTSLFRSGLKQRGLTELLELHLADFPPRDPVTRLLATREVKLAEFADPTRSAHKRAAAIAQANEIIEKLISENGHDPRRFEWQFMLAHSLIYEEAESLSTSILYRGGSLKDRQRLMRITMRAVAILTVLAEELEAEYQRIDGLEVREFERLEKSGYVERMDRLGPRARYLRVWAWFYDSLPRPAADVRRIGQLNRILEDLDAAPDILETSHEVSRVQIQALVLAGMTHRLLYHHVAARQHLDRALMIADRLSDPGERSRVRWAVDLASIARIRVDRDDGRFDAALQRLTQFRDAIEENSPGSFGLRIVAALLERSIRRKQADEAGDPVDAIRLRELAWQPILRLVRRHPRRHDEIYATLYDLIGADADPAALDPFEQMVLVAGLLSEASGKGDGANRFLDRAVAVGRRFVDEAAGVAVSLVPEVLYNVAVAEYHRGRWIDAAARFLEVARDHEDFGRALDAATHAVQIASELYADPSHRQQPEPRARYLEALRVLVSNHRESEAARYWRFYYAQLLEEHREFDTAAVQYALVHAQHDHYLDSLFFRVRCLAASLEEQAADSSRDRDIVRFQSRVDDFMIVRGSLIPQLNEALSSQPATAPDALLRGYLARIELLTAEVQVLAQVNRAARSLETLRRFEQAFPAQSELMGRVWRVRLLAFEQLGRLHEATKAIPAYVAADPENAGPTLQSLYAALSRDVSRLRAEMDAPAALRKAEVALVVAEQIAQWAERRGEPSDPLTARRSMIQLAEANQLAGRFERARELFTSCLDGANPSVLPTDVDELRVAHGYAESLYQLDEFETALPRFNLLATGLRATHPIRWQSLLRDLQCRAAMGHAPGDIVKVIQQQKYLYPDLGGPSLAPQFQKLLRQNQRRADGG